MTFESMSNLAAQQEYEDALREFANNSASSEYDKAIKALMKLYPQWKQFEWEQCLNEDVREVKEQPTSDVCPCCECTPCDCDWGMG
tara:strand:- start:33 stop:290 length:258 start_codon:yes stop_codon:yes gene_type:complete